MKFKAKVYFNHQKFRALAIPEDSSLDLQPREVQQWIGPKVTEGERELDTSEQLIGFDPQRVWDDFQKKGWSGFEITSRSEGIP
ncbi:hypothetical protein PPL19_23167 [Pseudomonas psychrotolerans L19]|uniref:hypothetical protein n=1 Tax=Pseudomonas oryzihabitans TaxID=47885 RepID=UPI00023A307A|nr:hypothetical protein [Pseudomonas psychrotolerans]EHK68647.1 hypothetical protein PPL19_23167 [Pseudomonas psychrotolerans L19]